MNVEELNELHAWCISKRVLHVSYDGVTLSLDPSALPLLATERPLNAHDVEDDEGEQETPQERIRREFAEEMREKGGDS